MRAILREILASGSIGFRFYILGYKGVCLPRRLRKLIARTSWHRAWLSGHMGIFIEDGRQTSVCDREWLQYRKGRLRRVEPGAGELVQRLLRPHAF